MVERCVRDAEVRGFKSLHPDKDSSMPKANLNRVRRKKAKPRGGVVGTCPLCRKGKLRRQETCTLCDGDGWVWVVP